MQQPLEQAVAETILQRFESFYSRFLEITQGSKSRFENSDWLGVQLAGRERIRLYDHHVGATTAQIKQMMGEQLPTQALLKQVKGAFSDLLPRCENFEVAESFEVPLSHFLDPANHQRHSMIYQGRLRHFHAMPYHHYYIWGATAGIIMSLYKVLREG